MGRRLCLAAWLAPLLLSALLPDRSAALDVVVDDLTIPTSESATTHFVDVYLRLGPGESPPNIAGYQVAVDLEPNSSVSLVSPFSQLTGTEHPPLITANFVPGFGAANGPLRASAAAFLDSGVTPGISGRGLMRLPVEIQPNTVGVFQITIDEDAIGGTLLADGAANPITYTAIHGELRVGPAVPIVLPSGRILLVVILCLVASAAGRLETSRPK